MQYKKIAKGRSPLVLVILVLVILLALLVSSVYYLRGYSLLMLVLFVASVLSGGVFFYLRRDTGKGIFEKNDILVIIILLLIFTPLYLAFLYYVPVRINSDEVAIMTVERNLVNDPNIDPFGLSSFFGLPSLVFLVVGWLGKALGGIGLLNMRIVHASFGLAIIVLSYLLFRTRMSSFFSAGAAIILGSNHVLLGISRMAMRDNSGLFIEVAALTLLMVGFQRKCLFYTFLGGLVTGLSFYVYFSGRITLVIWICFLVLSVLLHTVKLKDGLKFAGVCILGFFMVASPVIGATIKAPKDAFSYQGNQFLFSAEGRKVQMGWVGAQNIAEGMKINIINGLTTFNNIQPDHGWIYDNYGHGFLDPLSGVLVWIGVVIVLCKLRTIKVNNLELLSLAGLLLIWLILSFVIGKSPNYTRLLVVLPFVAFFVATAAKYTSNKFKFRRFELGKVLFGLFIVIIFFWNMFIFSDFANKGFIAGNDIGGTARYIEQRKNFDGYTFVVVTSEQHRYFSWAERWHEFFVPQNQKSEVVKPEEIESLKVEAPFTIFVSRDTWFLLKANLTNKYENFVMHDIKPDGSLLAFEVR